MLRRRKKVNLRLETDEQMKWDLRPAYGRLEVNIRPYFWTAWLALAVVAALPAAARDAEPRLLAWSCAGCHGPDGHSPSTIPSLYGRTAASVADILRIYRADKMPSTVMSRIAKGYSDAEIDGLAQAIATWK